MPLRKLSAILALDVVGYSRMMQTDAAGTLERVNAIYRTIVRPALKRSRGRVAKLMGDGAILEFSAASDALECAVEIQRQRADRALPAEVSESVSVRAGLHAGDVVVDGDDIFGDGINIATRLQGVAPPGGILASRLFGDLVGTNSSVRLRREGVRSLKGIEQPMEVLSVDLSNMALRERRSDFAARQIVRFCRSADGAKLAWTENGTSLPVVKAPNWIGRLELDWRNPGIAPTVTSVAERFRLIRFDARGNGLSDWDVGEVSFERFVDDLEAVFDAAGIKRAPIVAISQGSAVASAFAARHPDRVSAIVMMGSFPVGRAKRSSPKDRERAEALRSMMQAGWDDDFPSLRDLLAQIIVPAASEEDRRQYAQDMKQIISPSNMVRYRDVVDNIDVRELVAGVDIPCLMLHCTHDRMQPITQGRMFAASLPNARFVACDSDNHCVTDNDPIWPKMESDIIAFLTEHAG